MTKPAHHESQQLLVFDVETQQFAIQTTNVVEVRRWTGASRLPASPPCVLGVINVRGDVVPIVGLREFLALPSCEYGTEHVVILVRIDLEGRRATVGMLIDAVTDVFEIPTASLRATTHSSGNRASGYVRSVAMRQEEPLVVLDIEALLALATVQSGASSAA